MTWGKFWKAINPFTAVRDKLVFKYQFEPYFIIAVWLLFFFDWAPTHPEATYYIGLFFIAIVPFVLPFLLGILVWNGWFQYQVLRYESKREFCVLEIRLPEEITQSTYAAELMLRGIYQTGLDDPYTVLWGDSFPWFSLEIASDGGRVRFFMWGRRSYKQIMEAQIYAHYPDVQVVEVPDYTLEVPFDPAVMTVNGIEERLQKPDPYPIATYVELGLDKPDLKEEFKHDPMASVIEWLGSINPYEHVWIQFIIRAHTPRRMMANGAPWAVDSGVGNKYTMIDSWTKTEVKKITDTVTDKEGRINFNALTQGDKRDIEAMQNKINKQCFEVGIRGLYIAPQGKGTTSPRRGLASAFRSFEHGSEGRGLNGLRPIFWVGPFNYPWHDFMNIRRIMLRKRFYNAYVTRTFFYPPHRHKWIVLNTEELATMYHFPGRVVRTPNLQREPAKRAEAPANLPT